MPVNNPTTISNLIASQFPAFYNDNGPTLIAFLEAYYEWMEEQGNVINQTRNLLSYSDIDTTLDQFIIHFKNTYLQTIQFTTESDKRLTVKKIIDLYRAKGSVRALKLLFQLVFNEDVEVYFPGTDLIKPSDGIWTLPVYLEVSHTTRNLEYLGKLVTGLNSGATAFVDKIIRRNIAGKFIDIFYITNLSKDFQTGDPLTVDNNLNNIPAVIGSLSQLIVDDGSYGFNVGDLVTLTSVNGRQGIGRVQETQDTSGLVTFTLNDGGWGYTTGSNVLISTTKLYLQNVTSSYATNTSPITKFSTVVLSSPVVNLQISSTTGTFVANESLYQNSATALTGTFIANTANNLLAVNATSGATTSSLTAGEYLLIGNTDIRIVNNVVNSTAVYLTVAPSVSNNVAKALPLSAYGTISNAAAQATTLMVVNTGYFNVGSRLTGLTSGASANVAGVIWYSNVTANVMALSTTVNVYAVPILGSFVINEKIISSDGNATGLVQVAAQNTSSTILNLSNVASCYFAPGQIITGQKSGAQATVSNYQMDIGVINVNGAITNTHTSLTTTTGNATILGFSSGISANLSIANLNVTETLYSYTDYVGGQSTLTTTVSTSGKFVYGSSNIVSLGTTSGVYVGQNVYSSNATVEAGLTALSTVTSVINSTAVSVSPLYSGANATSAPVTFTGNTPYTSIALNASQYGFPKFPAANLTIGQLVDIIGVSVYNLGTIESIITTNPGMNYNDNPYVEVYEPAIAPKLKHDYILTLNNQAGSFRVGEEVSQSVPLSGLATITVSGVNGNVAQTATQFGYAEIVYQNTTPITGTFLANTANNILIANTGTPNFTTTFTSGEVLLIGGKDLRSVNNVINSTALYLNNAPYYANGVANVLPLVATASVINLVGMNVVANVISGTFSTSSGKLYGKSSGSYATVSVVNTATVYGYALGSVLSVNGTTLNARRLSILQDITSGYTITGGLSGATATVASSVANVISNVSGDNANVVANVFASQGTVANLVVQASGFGYIPNELITFTSADGTRSGTAKTVLSKQGTGTGYYSSTKGFLSADKYIQDSTYYQNFSYEIESSLDMTKYADMVREAVHVAGTKMFGAVIKKATISTPLNIVASNTGPSLVGNYI